MKAKTYRLGYVTSQAMTCYACCRLVPKENVIFEYIEVVYEDDSHKFFYEDERGFSHFEENFISKRFTSYHEFFTTKELAIEDRGGLKLKYFVRLGDDSYEKTDLKVLKEELSELEAKGEITKAPDRITEYGKYDKETGNHEI